ncbi:MAG TPA: heme NO-binding domain-containing protein [Ktedonobacterales bacterium]|nr:heme NO-binding domain-containing protein [Ktedonobacterales bacterium]
MQGFIHLLLEAYVSETIGSQHLRPIRQLAGISGPPLADHHYPDEVTVQLLQAISEYENIPLDNLLYRFGIYFMRAPLMHTHYRVFLQGHTSARNFLKQVPAIHQHLESSLHAVSLPGLNFVDHSSDLLEIIYDSPRHLCPLLQGILEGVGQYFGETLEVREMECQRRGALACRVLVSFVSARGSGPVAGHITQGDAGISRPQNPGDTQPSYLYSPEAALAAKRQRDEQEDMLILHALDNSRAAPAYPSKQGGVSQQPLYQPLSLFEIAFWLRAQEVSAEYTRLSLLQRSLTRLAVQGFIESKLDGHPIPQNAPSSAAALGGQGILAARRYRITPAGQAWLRDMQHQQDY